MNARYVIATKAKVDLKGIDTKAVDKVSTEGYFTREKAQQKKGEEQFFSQGEKPEVGPAKPYLDEDTVLLARHTNSLGNHRKSKSRRNDQATRKPSTNHCSQR